MSKKRIVFLVGNIIPILVSGIIYAVVSGNDLHLWVKYDAVIIPIYLLAFNFILEHKAFFAWKLLVILSVELICTIIHMAYFQFDFSSTSIVIWSFMLGIALAITIIGGLIFYFVSKKKRNMEARKDF